MQCFKCQAENPESSQFCRKCGQKFDLPTGKKCASCGHTNPHGSQFCNQCATPLTAEAQQRSVRQKSSNSNYNQTLMIGIAGLVIFVGILAAVFIPSWRKGPTRAPAVGAPANESATAPQAGMGPSKPYQEGDPSQNGELQTHLNPFKDALLKNPSDVSAQIAVGNLYYDFGFYIHAIEAYEFAQAIDSTNIDALVDCGTCYFYAQRPDEAIKLFEKAIRLEPKHANAYYNMAIVLNSTGHHEKAVEWFERALKVQPDGPMADRARSFIEKFNQMRSGMGGPSNTR